MKGQFRLYYRAGSVDQPCVNVNYEVNGPSGEVLASGQTDAKGETKTFDGTADETRCSMVVRINGRQWRAPDTVAGPDSATAMALAGPETAGIKVQKIRMVPYYQVRFVSHADRKPIKGAKFTAYAQDANVNRPGFCRHLRASN